MLLIFKFIFVILLAFVDAIWCWKFLWSSLPAGARLTRRFWLFWSLCILSVLLHLMLKWCERF